MILIFGGVYQGKLDYALERFGYTESDVAFCDDETKQLCHTAQLVNDTNQLNAVSCGSTKDGKNNCFGGKKIIYEIDKWILSLIRSDKDVQHEVKRFIECMNNCIIICNDISCGIVPIDPIMRRWRDEVGRSLGMLAQNSDEVIRLYCGIPTKLK